MNRYDSISGTDIRGLGSGQHMQVSANRYAAKLSIIFKNWIVLRCVLIELQKKKAS